MEEEVTGAQNKSSKTVGIIALVFVLLFAGGVALALFKGNNTTEMKKEEAVKEETVMEEEKDATGAAMEEKDAMMKEAKTFTVEGSPFMFSPKEIRAKKGDTVKIVFVNKQGFHDWTIDGFNAKTKQIKAGETDEVTFVADKAGTFEYYCSVGNHRQQGMVGKLVVE